MDRKEYQTPPDEIWDLTMLEKLSEEATLKVLRSRFDRDSIYTCVDDVLLCINPFHDLSHLFTDTMSTRCMGARLHTHGPHLFPVADAAFRQMQSFSQLKNPCNHSILISGESGSGKTEATKLLLLHLARIADSGDERSTPLPDEASGITTRILSTAPLLEAVGNAKTVRNNNSSRFGKFIKVFFNKGFMCGAQIDHYLLERSRIVHQDEGERNYHYFYQLLAGASDELLSRLGLVRNAEAYKYLIGGHCHTVEAVDDAVDFGETEEAMQALGFSSDEQAGINRLIGAVLHLGNISFSPADGGSVLTPESGDAQSWAATLLGVPSDSLGKALTTRTVTVVGEKISKPLQPEEANQARDALAKTVYSVTFNHLVSRINSSIGTSTFQHPFIGIADVFGFEVFPRNSFEQLVINHANEALQQHFVHFMLELEQADYQAEGVQWNPIEYKNNSACIELLESRPLGVMALLDEECRFPKATDTTFVEKITKIHAAHPHFHKSKDQLQFSIRHFAGEVLYDGTGFLEKNQDTLSADLSYLLMNTADSWASGGPFAEFTTIAPGPRRGSRATTGKETVVHKFKDQLHLLLATLAATKCSFVRCIKPNEMRQPRVFDTECVARQLNASGVMELCSIRKSGYSVRCSFKEFVNRYRVLLLPHPPPIPTDEQEAKVICIRIVQKHPAPTPVTRGGCITPRPARSHVLGKTKVFFTEEHEEVLDGARSNAIDKAARRVVFVFRKRIKMRRCAIEIQSCWRGFQARCTVKEMRIEAERVEAERVEAERVEAERLKRIEAERVEAERVEAERVEAERVEAERLKRIEAERVEAERVEAERVEAERLKRIEAERVEAERVEAERVEAERVEAERLKADHLLQDQKKELEWITESLPPPAFNPNSLSSLGSLHAADEGAGVFSPPLASLPMPAPPPGFLEPGESSNSESSSSSEEEEEGRGVLQQARMRARQAQLNAQRRLK